MTTRRRALPDSHIINPLLTLSEPSRRYWPRLSPKTCSRLLGRGRLCRDTCRGCYVHMKSNTRSIFGFSASSAWHHCLPFLTSAHCYECRSWGPEGRGGRRRLMRRLEADRLCRVRSEATSSGRCSDDVVWFFRRARCGG